jgi:hypothetical protein
LIGTFNGGFTGSSYRTPGGIQKVKLATTTSTHNFK